ncbi:MAG: hypothetical protein IPJ89_02695 [Candidatus Iainarchaeum archaeon]|uniref:Uncharacterized protein n=1 Tax=Candidatus Iainarchaeum sp. TaxID=3101447 RepID=A0A7T9DKR6_9ARCH|nr:MAG: hypothetical protein IPJ89_02695 [Candidatus Diapherotrites archaeon]
MAHPFRKVRIPRYRVQKKETIVRAESVANARKKIKNKKEVRKAHFAGKVKTISRVRHAPGQGVRTREISPQTLKRFVEQGYHPFTPTSRPRAFTRKNMIRNALMDYYNLLRLLRPIGGEISIHHPAIKEWKEYWGKKLGKGWERELLAMVSQKGHLSMREFAPYASSIGRLRWKDR